MTSSTTVPVRLARWSATHPWRSIALWLVFVAACVAVGSTVHLEKATDLDQSSGQSGRAQRWLHEAGLDAPDTENVLVTTPGGSLDAAQANATLADAAGRMRALPQVAHVGAPAFARDGTAATIQVTLRQDADVAPLLAATAGVQRAHPQLRVEQVGAQSLGDAIDQQVGDDLASASTISLPVTMVILLIAFGAIVAAGAPILLALSAVAAATGLSALASHVVPDSGTTSSMILLMGMAVGVDYSLFYVRRVREERAKGRGTLDAVEIAAETSGHSVLVSGVAVIVSMLGLFLADDVTFASLALGSIVVVAVAVLGSLTVLPALLVKLGRAVDRPRVPVLWRLTARTREPRLWPALLRPSLNRPVRTLVVAVGVLLALAAPALGLTLRSGSTASLPDSIHEKQVLQRLDAAFPDQHADLVVVVTAPAGAAATVDKALTALRGDAVRASTDGTVHTTTLTVAADAESRQARDAVTTLRDTTVPRAVDGIDGAQWAVGGEVAGNIDADRHLSDRLPWVVGFVVLLTMLIMGWVFRSAVLAVITAATNLLSAGASFGVLVLVFQHHWADTLLGYHSTGAVTTWIPLFTFAVLFGLSMDYHVFVLSRIREAAGRGLSRRDAIREGITASAGTVTSAAIVMVSVFAIFASLHMVEMKELGLGLAVAVLIDAVVVRVIVLPALLMLTGTRTPRAASGRTPSSRRRTASPRPRLRRPEPATAHPASSPHRTGSRGSVPTGR